MEDVIRKIIKIEEKAQLVMETTVNECKRKRVEHDEKLKALEEKIIGDAKRKALELTEKELSQNEVYAQSVKKDCDRRLEVMEQATSEKEDLWVKYLVDKVLGE